MTTWTPMTQRLKLSLTGPVETFVDHHDYDYDDSRPPSGMSATDWGEMRAEHALQCEEDMAQAEAIQSEELEFVERKFTHLDQPRDFQSVHPARTPAAYPEDALAPTHDA
eukprot:496410-Pleurochrysis_carterae.AAC.1